MAARLAGSRLARGDVLVFLDAHCEAGGDWLRPLLQRARHKRDAALTPLIDIIDQATFQLQAAQNFQVGGFTFMGHFTWIDVPEWEKKRRGSDIAPTWSPTMAGGLFAISREYFWEVGAYDEQMAGWGGENLEMSFRIWQCGGTLETIPCSRVGHVFRSFHPYGMPMSSDTHGINTARMAEVWMDEYAELFYLHRPDLRNNPKIGDVTHRKILREKLQCKSFQWYLDNIYKDKFVPVRDVHGYGRFRNPSSGLCLDTLQREAGALGLYPCHASLQASQYLSLTLRGQLRGEENCAHVPYSRASVDKDTSRPVLMDNCNNKHHGQLWRPTAAGQLQHQDSGLCLSAGGEGGEGGEAGRAGVDVRVRACSAGAAAQRWEIDYTLQNSFRSNDREPSDRELKLQKIGQRRVSRSLLAADEPARRHRGGHKRTKKRTKGRTKRSKNKFILKLVRTLMNGSDEHLEVQVSCSHRRLLPNNTFVRDLVSILNERNIKVINNGRVFERNKVTELGRAAPKVLHKMDIDDTPPEAQPVYNAPMEPPKVAGTSPPKQLRLKKRKPALPQAQPDEHPPNEYMLPLMDPPEATPEPRAAPFVQTPVDAADSKKIIIEDFIAVKPVSADGTTVRTRKRKRKRVLEAPRPPPALRIAQRAEDDQLEIPAPSAEDTPLLDAPDSDKSSAEHRAWRAEASLQALEAPGDSGRGPRPAAPRPRPRPRPAPARRVRPQRPRPPSVTDDNVEEELEAEVETERPLKVVVRSNLTFNLGDELFAWRREGTEDLTEGVAEVESRNTSAPNSAESAE